MNKLIQLIELVTNNQVFSLVINLKGIIISIFSGCLYISSWIRIVILGKNRKAYSGAVLLRVCDYKIGVWVRREGLFIIEFLLLLLNTYLILFEMYFSIFIMELCGNYADGKVYLALFVMGELLAILIICVLNATGRIAKNIKRILLTLSLSLLVLTIAIAFIPPLELNRCIYDILSLVSVLGISLTNYYIHKILQIENNNKVITLLVWMRYLIFVTYLISVFVFRMSFNNQYFIYIWLILCMVENFLRWDAEDKKKACVFSICTNYGVDNVKNSIVQYGDDKIAFKTDSGGTKIVNMRDVKCIKYQIENFKIRKKQKRKVYCQFQNGVCTQFDYYKFIGKRWVKFYSDSNNFRNIEVYKSEDIVKIEEK